MVLQYAHDSAQDFGSLEEIFLHWLNYLTTINNTVKFSLKSHNWLFEISK